MAHREHVARGGAPSPAWLLRAAASVLAGGGLRRRVRVRRGDRRPVAGLSGKRRTFRAPAGLVACAVATTLLSLVPDAWAYEQVTHAAMTREAMMQSQLNPTTQDLLQRLGIADRQVSLGQVYVDVDAKGNAVIRAANPGYSPGCVQSPLNFGPSLVNAANTLSAFQPAIDSLPGWLMLGAIREDDVTCFSLARENNPQDEPGGVFDRVFSHFFDPYQNIPLTIGDNKDVYGAAAPDWATQSIDFQIAKSYAPFVAFSHSNHFSTPLAREAMWRALTLKSAPASGMADLPFSPSTDIPTKEALRVAYWATTFRALGDIVHLLQDMAQPQHTRNDPHSGFCISSWCPYGHASYFEKYVDLLVTGQPAYVFESGFLHETLPDLTVGYARPPIYSGYPIPTFTDFRSYFVTATGAGSTSGFGMANYSNQGFYSAGTNIENNIYPSPPPNGQGLADVVLPDGAVQNLARVPVAGALTLKTGPVADSLNPGWNQTGIALSSRGMFDQFLQPAQKNQYTLNHYNYDAQVALLIPKAVAHSAGLMNYFFRGRMDISLPDEGVYGIVDHSKFAPPNAQTDANNGFVGFDKIRLRITNSTPSIAPAQGGAAVPQDMSNGTLVAVVRFHRNGCYNDSLDGEALGPIWLVICRTPTEEIVVSNPVTMAVPMSPSSAEVLFTFADNNNLPINAWDVVLQVVYRGQLGGEADAVAVATKAISEPTFITAFNDTDRILVNGTCYGETTVEQDPTLWSQLSAACKPTSGGQHQISSGCINVPLQISWTTAPAPQPVTVAWPYSSAQDNRLLFGRLGRFAVLGDLGTPTNGKTILTLGFNNGPLSLEGGNQQTQSYSDYVAAQQTTVTFTANTYQQTTSSVINPYVTHRGVKTWDSGEFVVDGTTGTVNGPCPDTAPSLQGANRYPQPATITGW